MARNKRTRQSQHGAELERYEAWLSFLFRRGDGQERFGASPHQVVALATHMFLRAGTDLRGYSDAEICEGLQTLFYNTHSDLVFDLMSASVPVPARVALIDAVPVLYRDCFEPRVEPVLGHLNESTADLNLLCYMLWDVSPLGYWANREHREEFNAALLRAFDRVLHLRNDACLESALHGLGHLAAEVGHERVRDVVDAFLASRRAGGLRPELRAYAEAAANGCVQ